MDLRKNKLYYLIQYLLIYRATLDAFHVSVTLPVLRQIAATNNTQTDCYNRWVEAYPLGKVTIKSIVDTFERELLWEQLSSDTRGFIVR